MYARHQTRQVKVGSVRIGGSAPISVQSMTNTITADVDATVRQIHRLVAAGCEMVRLAVPTRKDTQALSAILGQVEAPIIADVHFLFERALEAIQAGVHKIRLNPGTLRDRRKVMRVIDACRHAGIPIRVGVNAGSVRDGGRTVKPLGRRQIVRLMLEKLEGYLAIFRQCRFDDLVLSAKANDAISTIEVYRAMSERYEYPLHLGVTHAGPVDVGLIRSSVGLGVLLHEGIGNTIRVSLTGDPVQEARAGRELLYSLNLRERTEPLLVSCPTCGRVQMDMVKLVNQVDRRLKKLHVPVRVAVMGCVVNGPGEAADADVALIAGKNCGYIYAKGKRLRRVPQEQMVDALMEHVNAFVEKA